MILIFRKVYYLSLPKIKLVSKFLLKEDTKYFPFLSQLNFLKSRISLGVSRHVKCYMSCRWFGVDTKNPIDHTSHQKWIIFPKGKCSTFKVLSCLKGNYVR